MRRALNALIRLYPESWRNRYKNEFNALLDDVPPTWHTFFDVLGGALKMQLKVWSAWKIVPAFAALGLLGAVAFSFAVPNQYVSTAVIRIEDGGLEGVGSIIQRMESRQALSQLINEQGLYESERSRIPLEDVIKQMRTKDIRVAPVKSLAGGPPAISVSFTAADASKAQRITNSLVGQLMEASLHATADNPAGPRKVSIDPSQPVLVGPRRSRIVVMGVLAGIVAGVLFALFSGLKIWKSAALLGIAGAILLGSASYLEPERYSSSAVLAYLPADQEKATQAVRAVTSSSSLHELVAKFGLYPNDPRSEDKLREHLHVRENTNARAVSIDFDYPDQRVVHTVTQAMVAQLIKENWNFEIIDPATFPQKPFSPDRSMATGAGLLLGFVIAAILGIKERRVGHA
jgi:capsular polysaccharide biosynthesis protein